MAALASRPTTAVRTAAGAPGHDVDVGPERAAKHTEMGLETPAHVAGGGHADRTAAAMQPLMDKCRVPSRSQARAAGMRASEMKRINAFVVALTTWMHDPTCWVSPPHTAPALLASPHRYSSPLTPSGCAAVLQMLIMTQAGLAFKKGQHGEGQPAQQPPLNPASIGADEDAKAGAVITTGGDKPCESVQEPANGWLRGNEKLHIAMARVLSVLPGAGAVPLGTSAANLTNLLSTHVMQKDMFAAGVTLDQVLDDVVGMLAVADSSQVSAGA